MGTDADKAHARNHEREHTSPGPAAKLRPMLHHFPIYPKKPGRNNRARICLARKDVILDGAFDSDESHKHYNRLRQEWVSSGRVMRTVLGSLTFAEGLAEFLAWSRLHQKPATTYGPEYYGTRFRDAGHGDIPLVQLIPYTVTRWVDGEKAKRSWSSTTAANATRFIARVASWCEEQRLIPKDSNPLEGMARPKARSKRRLLTDAEYRALLRGADPAFRRLLVMLRWTGARPQELRELTWEQVRPDRIVLTEHKTTATDKAERDRVIWLVGPAAKLLAWLRSQQESTVVNDHVFLTPRGRPWTAQRLCHVLAARRKAAGVAKGAVAYGARHWFGTNAVLNGLDLKTLAQLMGNSPEVAGRDYVHLAEQHEHLAGAAAQAVRRPGKAG
jgi:integrase